MQCVNDDQYKYGNSGVPYDNSLSPEARLSQQQLLLGTRCQWALSAQIAPRKAVDLDHLLLNCLPFKI